MGLKPELKLEQKVPEPLLSVDFWSINGEPEEEVHAGFVLAGWKLASECKICGCAGGHNAVSSHLGEMCPTQLMAIRLEIPGLTLLRLQLDQVQFFCPALHSGRLRSLLCSVGVLCV